ncbi:Aste57867_19055 [Aphanomyces stellatus]|uniref:Aste57867_19055 protein n=1 Tax=Aphanomyces stellatus TaxID=120398 RepID=A0A485LFX4_9STRA|nr:hypothetical protein As57867_018991 [Aphanomyces stellatus]VFT95780.1 Aste57867_19055 [Aphanomyces stellatus]
METLATTDVEDCAWRAALTTFRNEYEATSTFERQWKRQCCLNVWARLKSNEGTIVRVEAHDPPSVLDTLLCLNVIKIFMRERIDIDPFLSLEAFRVFLDLAESKDSTEAISLEALKCAINSVYARPEFVSSLLTSPHYDRLFHLTTLARPFEFHTLVWKCLLMSFENPAAIERVERTLNGYDCILPTIRYCLECSSFAKDSKCVDLVTELLKTLYVLAASWQNASQLPDHIDNFADQAMALLSAVLGRPNSARVLALKFHVQFHPAVNLLLLVQHPLLVESFVQSGGMPPLVSFLTFAIMKVRVEKTENPSVLTPVVIALHQLAKNNREGFRLLKVAIFNDETSPVGTATPEVLTQLPMNPPAAAKGSLQESFCSFMTSTDTDLKRCVSEFLFTLCHHNALEFTQRTGMGNAVALLRLKGIV